MNFLAVIANAFLYRLDGWGFGDNFLPCWPFNQLPKWGGINYARYLIGFTIWACTHNPIFVLTYTCAVSLPYGEKHWWMRYGLVSWFFIGAVWGLASLMWPYALFMGTVVVIAKVYDLDHAWWEFGIMGFLGTAWVLFK